MIYPLIALVRDNDVIDRMRAGFRMQVIIYFGALFSGLTDADLTRFRLYRVD